MTTLNTIIEEEKREFDTDIRPHIGNHTEGADHGIADDIWERNATAMQRAYEAGREEAYRRGFGDGVSQTNENAKALNPTN